MVWGAASGGGTLCARGAGKGTGSDGAPLGFAGVLGFAVAALGFAGALGATAATVTAPPVARSAREAGIGIRTRSPRPGACAPFQPLVASSLLKVTPLAAAT